MDTVSEIEKSFLKSKLKDLELGVRFRNSLPKIMENYTVGEFLEEFDPIDNILIGAGKRELDLFRLHLEASGVDWHKYKIRRLFKLHSFRKGIFLDNNKLKSEDFNFIYSDLHIKRAKIEKGTHLTIF